MPARARCHETYLGLGQVLLQSGVQARALQRQQLAHERHVAAHRRRLLLFALPQVRIQALRMRAMPYEQNSVMQYYTTPCCYIIGSDRRQGPARLLTVNSRKAVVLQMQRHGDIPAHELI